MKKTKKPDIGFIINIDYAQTVEGFWWRNRESPSEIHGPFRTEAEAEKNAEATVLGPDCKVEDAGQWNPNWDKLQ